MERGPVDEAAHVHRHVDDVAFLVGIEGGGEAAVIFAAHGALAGAGPGHLGANAAGLGIFAAPEKFGGMRARFFVVVIEIEVRPVALAGIELGQHFLQPRVDEGGVLGLQPHGELGRFARARGRDLVFARRHPLDVRRQRVFRRDRHRSRDRVNDVFGLMRVRRVN